MNTKSFYLLVLLLTTTFAFGSVKPIPITSATIEWKAYKIAYERWGTIQLKSGELLFEDDALTGGNFVVDMTSIQVTIKGNSKHPVYDFLTDANKNGVKSSNVTWNFQKYLIDEEGKLVDVISPRTQPDDPRIINWIKS